MKKLIVVFCLLVGASSSMQAMEYVAHFSKAIQDTLSAQSFELMTMSSLATLCHALRHNFNMQNTQLKHAFLAGWAGMLVKNCFFNENKVTTGIRPTSSSGKKINKVCARVLETSLPLTWLYYECKNSRTITFPIAAVGTMVGIRLLDAFN